METSKKCSNSKCSQINLSFSSDKNTTDGFQKYCKLCSKEKYNTYTKSKNGIVSTIYKNQKANSKRREHNPPTYAKQELKDWLFSQPIFHKLYSEWVESGYDKDLKPSVDRINDNIGYTMDNIQLMTWDENNKKGNQYMRKGIVIATFKPHKKVLQFDENRTLIAEFASVNDAARNVIISSASVSIACNSLYPKNKSKGFFWEFKN